MKQKLKQKLVLLGVGGGLTDNGYFSRKKMGEGVVHHLANWWFLCFVLGGMLMNY